jgi:hypothetical protein
VGGNDHRLAPGQVMPRSDVARAPPLLQELLNHPEGNPKTIGNLSTSAFVVVIAIKNPLPEIQRERAHAPDAITPHLEWLHYLLKCSKPVTTVICVFHPHSIGGNG